MYKKILKSTSKSNEVNTMKNTNKGSFAELLRQYETATRNRNNDSDSENIYTTALTDLATACTYSVLKKLCNVGGTVTEATEHISDTTKTIRALRRGVTADLNLSERITYAGNKAKALKYNDNGELISVMLDKGSREAFNTLTRQSFSDGMDLVHTAVIAILDQTAKQEDLNGDFMEKPYAVRRLKRKVYIKQADSVGGYEDATTTAIQEVYKAIRRDIENNRSMQVASNEYTYIDDVITDTNSGATDTIYRRLPKYSHIASEVTDINGKVTAITADSETADEIDRLVGAMNLTSKQAKVLNLRLSGYGYKAIATYLGVTQRAVAKTVQAIQKKAKDFGLDIDTND